MVLMIVPSVRALKVQFGGECKMSCQKSEDSECEKGKFIMSLNFSPVQFVKEIIIYPTVYFIPLKEKPKTIYRIFLVSNYFSNIWHPPKI